MLLYVHFQFLDICSQNTLGLCHWNPLAVPRPMFCPLTEFLNTALCIRTHKSVHRVLNIKLNEGRGIYFGEINLDCLGSDAIEPCKA